MAGSDNGRSFAAALQDKNLHLAVVTEDESRWIHRGNPYLQEPGKYVPNGLRTGEWVVLNEQGHIYQLTARNTGKNRFQLEKFMAPLDRKDFQGIEATREDLYARATEREILRQAFRDLSSVGLLPKGKKPDRGRSLDGRHEIASVARVLDRATATLAGSSLNVVADALDSLFAPAPTPEQKLDAEIAQHDREAQAQRRRQRESERER